MAAGAAMPDEDFNPLAVPLVRRHLEQCRAALVFIDGLTGADDAPVTMTVLQVRILGVAVRAWVSATEATFFGEGVTKQ
jgi:hypothetical protein